MVFLWEGTANYVPIATNVGLRMIVIPPGLGEMNAPDVLCQRKVGTGPCSQCGGDGLVDIQADCSHGRRSTHSYCSHNKTAQHDN